jgi:hypothetical protein
MPRGGKHHGRVFTEAELVEMLCERADCSRDFESIQNLSAVWSVLYLDRDLPYEKLGALLLVLTHPAVRLSRVFVVTRFAATPENMSIFDYGLALNLDPVYLTSARIRVEATAAELVLRASGSPDSGTDLSRALTAMSGEDRTKGVRLRCGPDVSAE